MFLLILSCTTTKSDTDTPSETAAVDTGEEIARAPLAFALPLEDDTVFETVLGVDHDPEVHEGFEQILCTNYAGEPWCYDEHDGTDYLLDGTWEAMDSGSVWILAAADGVVIETHDGEYDRCHGDLTTFEVSCDGYPMIANKVVLEHEGGYQTSYLHMMRDSVAVAVGDVVSCGDRLGLVGSSGRSSQPHLHFELQAADGEVIDPYAGEFSQPETWWVDQGESDALPAIACWEDD